MSWSWIPTAITLARVLASLPLFWVLMEARYLPAFWLALAAGLSDAADGIIAKRFGWQSVIGGLLDPIADKLLLTSCFLGLWWSGQLPGWLVALVIGRDVVILLGAFAWWRLIGAFKPEPSVFSKSTTFLQLLLVVMELANLAGYPLAAEWLPAIEAFTGLVTLVSGLDYVVRYGARARRRLGKDE
jgi:cardiolipin synthase